MLLGLTVVITVFFVTALWGRVWCGWGCPQTVYLEHVFRPIERLWEGSPSEQRKLDAAKLPSWRRIGKWVTYAALSFALANVFLAYFVGTDRLERLGVSSSPTEHPVGFGVVVFVTAAMVFDFTYFREQTCIVACPYGRLQSVMLDKQSLIIGYDATRGEPRGKPQKKKLPVVGDEPAAAASARRLRRLRRVRDHVPDRHRHPRWPADGVHRLRAVHRRLRPRDGQAREAARPDPLHLGGRAGRQAAARSGGSAR
jgi:cytochrome c oxidase accessory protein FixG